MKQILVLTFLSVVLFGCNSPAKTDEVKSDSTAKTEPLVYPYAAKYSLNWQPGDEKNAVIALNSFKKFSDGDVKGCFSYFADSVEFIADKYYFKGKKDSLMVSMNAMRADLASMSVEPDTWITTYYPDKKDTWVTIWSTERYTDKKGKVDSMYLVDDVQVKDGKITVIDEKQRAYPEPKTKK